jgi:hypothetical protein
VEHASTWWSTHGQRDAGELEAGGRAFAMTLGRSLSLALLVEHAQWALDVDDDGCPMEAACRLAAAGVDYLPTSPTSLAATRAVALDLPLRHP